jgi:site-specific recombinase
VIAIFGDQHLREHCRRRQTAGDRPLRRRHLGDRAAGAAGVFWTQDAHDAKLRRNPIQHLADALADRMERAAATRASLPVDIETDILARQMLGQGLASGRRLSCLCFPGRTALADARNVAVEVFQGERHLVWIEALGVASELRPLELLDDELKALDLAVAALDDRRHVAHQMVQERRIDGQIVEIDSHSRFYFKRPSDPSVFLCFA